MRRWIYWIVLLGLAKSTWALEYGRFGPTNSTSATLTIAAVGGAGGGGVQDRNCLTHLSVAAGTTYGPGSTSLCTFTVASAGTTMWVVSISTANPAPVVANWPPPSPAGTVGYGMCGTAGQSVTVTASNCGTTYYINAQGYIDR